MVSTSISPATARTRLPGSLDPRLVHVGDVIAAFGKEGRVRRIDTDAQWPLAPKTWIFDAVAVDGAEIVVPRHEDEHVDVVRYGCPEWRCPQPGCSASGRAPSWPLAAQDRVEHARRWHAHTSEVAA